MAGLDPGYTLPARILHWLTAAIVLSMIPVGLVMANFDLGSKGDLLFDVHRSLGAIVLPIVLIRLVYRLTNPPPPLPADIIPVQQLAAHFTHWALYLLLIVQSFVGWVATSAYRAPIIVFWLFELPPIWPVDKAFSEKAFLLHRLTGFTLIVIIGMHVGAALFHHFIRKDRVMMRMISS